MITQITSIIDILNNGALPGLPNLANLSTNVLFTPLSPPTSWDLCLIALIVTFCVNPQSLLLERTNVGHLSSHFFFGLTF